MELFWLLFLLLLPLLIASVIWWFRAARGIVRAADALERIALRLLVCDSLSLIFSGIKIPW